MTTDVIAARGPLPQPLRTAAADRRLTGTIDARDGHGAYGPEAPCKRLMSGALHQSSVRPANWPVASVLQQTGSGPE